MSRLRRCDVADFDEEGSTASRRRRDVTDFLPEALGRPAPPYFHINRHQLRLLDIWFVTR